MTISQLLALPAQLLKTNSLFERPLRSEFEDHRQHEESAKIIAAHGSRLSKWSVLQPPLLRRFRQNDSLLRQAHQEIRRAANKRESLTIDAEWLLDNFYVIEQVLEEVRKDLPRGFYRKLPELTEGRHAGTPRIYELAVSLVALTDSALDQKQILSFIQCYQTVTPLTIGELWAIPTMFRIALIENLRRLSSQILQTRDDQRMAVEWAAKAVEAGKWPILHDGPSDAVRVALSKALRDHAIEIDSAPGWLAPHSSEATESLQRELQRQAANQVTVGNCVTSLRLLNVIDWRTFCETASHLEAILRQDPAGIHARQDFETRDRTRKAVEYLAEHSGREERAVAMLANTESQNSQVPLERCVGWRLIGKGRHAFSHRLDVIPPTRDRIISWILDNPSVIFFGSIVALEVAILSLVVMLLVNTWQGALLLVLFAIIPASEIAVGITNYILCKFLTPRVTPKIDCRTGIPDDCATFVVIPGLISDDASVSQLLERIELHYLANPQVNLYFALLTDYADAPHPHMPNDEMLLNTTINGIKRLNTRYGEGKADQFFLFHRERQWNEPQQAWMGWERKRGKLEEFFRLLRGDKKTSYTSFAGESDSLASIRLVLTLDTDTVLPSDTVSQLVSILAHPLNQAVISADGRRVESGYGILQPRVSYLYKAGCRTWFSKIFASTAGIDPYSRPISDIYQDLFGQGTFLGKGLIDVDAFIQTAGRAFPENTILSHDLIESAFSSCCLATDIEVFDEFPGRYHSFAKREHRWVRGDWQLLPWLGFKVPTPDGPRPNITSLLDRWKIVDNLRRSLLPQATIMLLLVGWLCFTNNSWAVTLFAVVVVSFPVLLSLFDVILNGLRRASPTMLGREIFHAAGLYFGQAILPIIFLPYRSILNTDAIFRTLWRVYGSHQRLLEWETAAATESRLGHGISRFLAIMWHASLTAIAVGLAILWINPMAIVFAAPFLLLWISSPAIAYWISQPIKSKRKELTPEQVQALRLVARRTWSFFEKFVGPEDQWLPPDNFQEDPGEKVAHRTSPTNIGLMLVATLAAYDLGYITAEELVRRMEQTFTTLAKLERYRGHFLNWYDTQTLESLLPKYVSTVDSGNLAGCLISFSQGLREIADSDELSEYYIQGLHDTWVLLDQSLSHDSFIVDENANDSTAVMRHFTSEDNFVYPDLKREDLSRWLDQLKVKVVAKLKQHQNSANGEASRWGQLLLSQIEEREKDVLLKFQNNRGDLLPSAAGVMESNGFTNGHGDFDTTGSHSHIGQKSEETTDSPTGDETLRIRLLALADQAESWASKMGFRSLFDDSRKLFSIGYNISLGRLDGSYYDLLASEANLASFLAIARGDVPREHWFHLGRLSTLTAGLPGLVSWGGTMFEYLMPRLFLPIAEGTLLDAAQRAAVARQIEYGKEKGVPWGISESSFYYLDAGRDYQYQAFGVPGLGLKRDLGCDLVIAPYATMLAVSVDPIAAIANMEVIRKEEGEGPFGFYEAIDYTPARLEPGEKRQVVKSYMAHHQGMGLLAIANRLTDNSVSRRLRAEPMVRAVELLLDEKVPLDAPLVQPAVESLPTVHGAGVPLPLIRRLTTPDTPEPRVHLLSNGHYSIAITNAGGGYSVCNGVDVSRWRADQTMDSWGSFVYVRDRSRGDVWSAGFQPIRKTPKSYEVTFSPDKAEIRRIDDDIETTMEVVVAPDRNIEVRRVTLVNNGNRTRTLELTSYAEIVLRSHAADVAHPAFGKLFIETEWLPQSNAIICRRRPRGPHEAPLWVVHVLQSDCPSVGAISFETDRSKFLGRRRSVDNPLALDRNQADLSGSEGAVLDPIVSLRRAVRVAPGARLATSFTTGVAETREEAEMIADIYGRPQSITHVFELAWAHSQVELRHPEISADEATLYQRVAGHVIHPCSGLRASPAIIAGNRQGQSGLWRHGVSGDWPIVVLRLTDMKNLTLLKQLLEAHSFWRAKGLIVDLLILNEEPNGYFKEMQERVSAMLRGGESRDLIDQPGGVFLRKAMNMPEDDRNVLLASARIVLSDSRGSLGDQIDVIQWLKPTIRPAKLAVNHSRSTLEIPENTQFFNGFGGFCNEGKQYVIAGSGEPTPAPWANVISNKRAGCVVTEAGGGFTWVGNSQTNRLTPWSNDPVSDQVGEAIYIRDDLTGRIWSPTPLPVHSGAPIEVSHGQGYTTFHQNDDDITCELTMFVPTDDPVKLSLLKLRNDGRTVRRLSVTYYLEWVLGSHREATSLNIVTEEDEETGALFATNAFNLDFGSAIAFADVSRRPRTLTGDRTEFLGRNGSYEAPSAIARGYLSGKTGAALDPCAALQTSLVLTPGEETTIVFVLGQADDRPTARKLCQRYQHPRSAESALQASKQQWEQILGSIEVTTPSDSMNLLLNRWLLYQSISCRLWGRSGFFQSGGAYGFRDQLQDVMAMVYSIPAEVREHLLRAARQQFPEGDVQHWWHPPFGRGVRTRCSDDFLWLVFVACHYVRTTGDADVFNEMISFIDAPLLNERQEDSYGTPQVTETKATLYEHCVRSLQRGWRLGEHSLPLMGGGDWNDGMNQVGLEGKGESVWVAWFQISCLRQFAEVAENRGDKTHAEEFRQRADLLLAAVEANAWDGEWYRRAYFDNGVPLGSAINAECQIDSIVQSWAVIAGGDTDRAKQAMDSALTRLLKKKDRLLLLFDPPFDHGSLEPGYIKGYVPGIRENGGQYTHASMWALQALALLGRGTDVVDLFETLSPIRHTDSLQSVKIYKGEPYVIAADVYGLPPHAGRAGWTWYTGAASWFYRVGLESILGFQLRGDHLIIQPCIPKSWKQFAIKYQRRATRFSIEISNPNGVEHGVTWIRFDGQPLEGNKIPLPDDGKEHVITVEMGF